MITRRQMWASYWRWLFETAWRDARLLRYKIIGGPCPVCHLRRGAHKMGCHPNYRKLDSLRVPRD